MMERVSIREVGLRDGLQSLATVMPTAVKQEWCDAEFAAGVKEIEVASLVPPRLLPQFADADLMVQHALSLPGLTVTALIPNARGAERGIALGVHKLNYVLSVSETHNQSNVRRSTADSIEDFRRIVALIQAQPEGRRPVLVAGLATSFGCTFEGAVSEARVRQVANELAEAGADELVLADTVGFASPVQVRQLFTSVRRELGPMKVAAHFHDTRGLGIANVQAALEAGVRAFDASLAGLGGCPFAPGATGNVVTEDVAFLCAASGLATGIDIDHLVEVRAILARGCRRWACSGTSPRPACRNASPGMPHEMPRDTPQEHRAMTVMARISPENLTERLVEQARATGFESLGPETIQLVRQCVLDYVGVTLAGVTEPASEIVFAEMLEQGGTPNAQIFGREGARLPALSAALVNGTASHALDYDDVNLAMPGHLSVAILSALLALAEELRADGKAVITAFVAGYELQCRLGRLLAPNHYDGGFHPTGTLGTFGAAAACARLMELDTERTAFALGIAGTQAAGLKAMFGTMCKPFHAGKAAANGLLAARLARRGFGSQTAVIEAIQGFAATHSPDFHPNLAFAMPPGGTHLRHNLFKYHAACYLTHAAIEASRALRDRHGLVPDDIRSVQLRLDTSCGLVCNIPSPRTGLETKFSLRHTCAMALAGRDTAALASYSDVSADDPVLVDLRQKVKVEFAADWSNSVTEVDLELRDGRRLSARHDSGEAAADLDEQGKRLHAKFMEIVSSRLGEERAAALSKLIDRLDVLEDISELAACCI